MPHGAAVMIGGALEDGEGGIGVDVGNEAEDDTADGEIDGTCVGNGRARGVTKTAAITTMATKATPVAIRTGDDSRSNGGGRCG